MGNAATNAIRHLIADKIRLHCTTRSCISWLRVTNTRSSKLVLVMAVKDSEDDHKIALRVLVAEEVAFSLVLAIRMLEKRCSQLQHSEIEMDGSKARS
jgi:hypothetical protein